MTSAFMPKTEGQLKINGGKCAKIEPKVMKSKITHQIVAKSVQETDSKVTQYTKRGEDDDENVYVAFCFELQNKKYFPVVKKKKDKANKETVQFQLESLPESQVSSFDKKFLFKWTETKGQWKSLKSAAEPSWYLSVNNDVFIMSPKPETGFAFK